MGGTLLTEKNELALLLTNVLNRQAALSDAFDRIQKPKSQARSVMACDNLASAPMQLEHFVSYCLLQAVDLGRAMRSMLRGDDGSLQVPIMAFYPLVRAQIESASMAIWVMIPEDRRSRVLRRLQAAHDELTHERALTKSGLKGRSPSEANDLLRKEAVRQKRQKLYLRKIASTNGITFAEYENSLPAWEVIVREAGASIDLHNDALVVVWRLASGFTHPSFRRGTSVLEFTHPGADGDVLSGVLSSRKDWTISLIGIAGRVSGRALERFRDLKLQVNGERPVHIVPKC